MIKSLEELQTTHPQYQNNKHEWKFLYDSYVGGPEYQSQGYLTRYLFESDEEYQERVETTPYDNHCKAIVHLYNSFIFAHPPVRELNDWADDPNMIDFLEDSDFEGRNFDQFMRQVDIQASIYGHTWIVMDKPNLQLNTLADEQALGIRPYCAMYTPLNVLDWNWSRQFNGRWELDYLKVLEHKTEDEVIVKVWDRESVITYRGKKADKLVEIIDAQPNALGIVPAVVCYSSKTADRGVGLSELHDIARINKTIYDHTSEMIQIIRLANHPSLVKTAGTEAGAGPGAIIQMEDNLPGDLKPYLLQPDSQSLDGVRETIKEHIESINKIAAVGSVRATESRTMSGVALETEMRTLNAKLSEKADNLELCEEQLFNLWALWQNTDWVGTVKYADSFNARDRHHDMQLLLNSREMFANNPEMLRELEKRAAEIIIEDSDVLSDIYDSIERVGDDAITERRYPDGSPFAVRLPEAYQHASNPDVPENQQCLNCVHYIKSKSRCNFWEAKVKPQYWCQSWAGNEDDGE